MPVFNLPKATSTKDTDGLAGRLTTTCTAQTPIHRHITLIPVPFLSRAGVPQTQLRHFYLTVIRPVLEYAAPVWHHLITKTQADQIEAIQKSHPCHLYMHTRYALSKCHICSRPSHYVRPQGSTVQKIFQFHSTAYFPST